MLLFIISYKKRKRNYWCKNNKHLRYAITLHGLPPLFSGWNDVGGGNVRSIQPQTSREKFVGIVGQIFCWDGNIINYGSFRYSCNFKNSPLCHGSFSIVLIIYKNIYIFICRYVFCVWKMYGRHINDDSMW